jgi:Mce-associated membrane protein
MTVSLYDVLDLNRDATPDQVRDAWKSAIAGLEPGDRRFRAYNDAAEVLLDPDRRAAYDAELADQEGVDEPPVEDAAPPAPPPAVAHDEAEATGPGRVSRAVSSNWLPAVLLALTVAFSATAAWLIYSEPSDASVERSLRTAEGTAEVAAPVIFSYDYRQLEEDHDKAAAYLTSDFREDYDKLFDSVVTANAERAQTVQKIAFIDSGVVRTGGGREADDRVDVMVVFDQLTTNKQVKQAEPAPAYAVLTMEKVDGDWLVDDIKGPAVPE